MTAEFGSFVLQDPGGSIMHMDRAEDTRVAMYYTMPDFAVLAWVVAEQAKNGTGPVRDCALAISEWFESVYIELTPAEQACLSLEGQP